MVLLDEKRSNGETGLKKKRLLISCGTSPFSLSRPRVGYFPYVLPGRLVDVNLLEILKSFNALGQ